MLVIVCYDVNTETRAGRRRLRRVAKVCECMGQRVQKSVFECQIDLAGMEEIERRLLREIDLGLDCLRLYRMADTRGCEVVNMAVSKPLTSTNRWSYDQNAARTPSVGRPRRGSRGP